MGLWQRLRPSSRVVIEINGERFEAEGDTECVERSLDAFLGSQAALMRARARLPAPSVAPCPVPAQPRTAYVRVHAIEGDIAKIYPMDTRRLESTLLGRTFDLKRIGSIYIESTLVSRQLKGNQETLWHLLLPPAPRRVLPSVTVQHTRRGPRSA